MLEELLTFPWKNLFIYGATYAGNAEHTPIIISGGKVIYHILNKFLDLNNNVLNYPQRLRHSAKSI